MEETDPVPVCSRLLSLLGQKQNYFTMFETPLCPALASASSKRDRDNVALQPQKGKLTCRDHVGFGGGLEATGAPSRFPYGREISRASAY